jgi:hypothetical protein
MRFTLDEDAQVVVVEEFGPVAKIAAPILMSEGMRELSALEIYMTLTPEDAAVPRALYELGAPEAARPALAKRALVEATGPMMAHLVSFRLVDTDQSSGHMASLCGASGASAFEGLCATNNSPESHCASGKHTWHGRTSNNKFNKSEGLAVSCQASVRTEHRRKVGLWYDNVFHMDADEFWHFTRVENYAPASKYTRYVRMDRYNPTSPDTSVSYIRSWIGFRN